MRSADFQCARIAHPHGLSREGAMSADASKQDIPEASAQLRKRELPRQYQSIVVHLAALS
jgi:hypothetical protein